MSVSGTEERVCQDIAARQALGVSKYGTTVEGSPLNLREWLQHAYEECLDQAVYLKRAIEQIDAEEAEHFREVCDIMAQTKIDEQLRP